MRQELIPQRFLLRLIALALILPVGVFVILGLSRLLLAMGDEPGSVGAVRLAVACGGIWLFDLICLILVVAINAIAKPDDPPEDGP
jgi:hypothetical protein